MPGLVPGIHVFLLSQDVDGRDKPGHDVGRIPSYFFTYFCTRQFSVSATKTSPRGLTAM
jgi:2-oxoglutarate ferredoxin oxidoreductase subunit beta